MHGVFTAVYLPVAEGYLAFVEELPEVRVRASTLEQARKDLADAVAQLMETNRATVEESLVGESAIRESLEVESRSPASPAALD